MLPPFQTVSCIPGCLDDPELLVFLSLRPTLRSQGSTTTSGLCGTENHTQDFVYAKNALTLYQLSYNPSFLLFCILNKCLFNELTFICNLIHLKRFTFNFKLCVCPWACISSASVHRDQRCLILLEMEFLADVSCLSFSNYICLRFHKT